MTPLNAATAGHATVIHAAAAGDVRTVCGSSLDHLQDLSWDSAPEQVTCPRCRSAVQVLLASNAL